MTPVKNLDGKRVCDINSDLTCIVIQRGDCVTIIKVDKYGQLVVGNSKKEL